MRFPQRDEPRGRPAAMSVVTAEQIAGSLAAGYGDVLLTLSYL